MLVSFLALRAESSLGEALKIFSSGAQISTPELQLLKLATWPFASSAPTVMASLEQLGTKSLAPACSFPALITIRHPGLTGGTNNFNHEPLAARFWSG